ncbi:hypothetical protein N7495_006212 [Penicillium taxi]|uniref:uncharacterized protein n=1 Tax=Penicillium taxi TaxID=168475 RepID=UPI0025457CD7|nr:uncharacterized protein N7495_006212 [Penicillium taxi]KAJ5894521.1 hypothetical protein N7495_006212 [Penicillium taxi]
MTVVDRPLDVLIVGAGISGLCAAISLGKQGHRVVIVERSAFIKETGAAIHLPPNSTSLLRWMGIDPADFGGTLLREIHRYTSEGDLKFKKDYDDIRHLWQAEYYLVHRIDLHNHLKKRALETATLHTSCRIITINAESDRPSVTLADGRSFEADVLLGADGIHSQTRGAIAPEAPAPYPVGKSCFRWLLPIDQLKEYESTQAFVGRPGVFIEWAAEDRRLVAYPCGDSKIFNLCAFMPSNESKSNIQVNSWQAVGDKSVIASAFSRFCPGVQKIIDSAEDLKMWDMYDMKALPAWVSNNTALIGDSAHPFQPYLGQGGAMAIEDAIEIATLLPMGTQVVDIPRRLEIYQASRQPRVNMVLDFTRLNGRDQNDPTGARITPADMVNFMGICFSYNAIEHSKSLLKTESVK